jgi:hypothetical protein
MAGEGDEHPGSNQRKRYVDVAHIVNVRQADAAQGSFAQIVFGLPNLSELCRRKLLRRAWRRRSWITLKKDRS